MPLTVSWPPSRNHPLPLFLSPPPFLSLSLSLSLSRLYSTVNHNARLFIQDYIGYYALNVAIRFLPSPVSLTVSRASPFERSNTKENDKGETLAEMVYSEKLEKTHSIERSVIFTRETILGFSSLLGDPARWKGGKSRFNVEMKSASHAWSKSNRGEHALCPWWFV